MASKIFGDRWENIQQIGEGGQSHIFLVKDKTGEFEGSYVLKRLKNINRIERFEQEINAGIALDHPQISPILNFSFDGDKPYFVTKRYLGPLLTSLAPVPPLHALEIFIKICDAVAYAHSKGIVHRDLKPDNIIFDEEDGNPIILDFGICYFSDENNRLTQTMEQVGSRYYIAPELEDGRSSSVENSVDAYALGKILYFLLTGNIFARENYTGTNDLSTVCENSQLDYISERIFDKSVVNDPDKRISVEDLRQQAVVISKLLYEHFYPGRVGSKCRFCGEGTYQAMTIDGLNGWNYVQSNRVTRSPSDQRLRCEAISCDACGNIQWFKAD